MTDLTEMSVAVLHGRTEGDALARRLGFVDPDSIRTGAEVAVRLLVDRARRQLAGPDAGSALAQVVGRIDPSGLADAKTVFESGRYGPTGLAVVDHLLDSDEAKDLAAGRIAESAGLLPSSAAQLLSAAGWVVGAHLHRLAGSPPDREALVAAVGPVQRRSLPPAPASSLAPIVSGPPDGFDSDPTQHPTGSLGPPPSSPEPTVPQPAPMAPQPAPTAPQLAPMAPTVAPVVTGPIARAPAPPAGGQTQVSAAGGPSPVPPAGGPAAAPAVGGPAPRPRQEPRRRPDDDVAVGSSVLVTGVAVVLGLLVAGAGLWWWLDGRDDEPVAADRTEAIASDPQTDESTDSATSGESGSDAGAGTGGEEAGTSSGDAQSDATPSTGEVAQRATLFGPDGLATVELSMLDPIGRTTATGAAGLVFDPTGGEICYEMTLAGVGAPADGHIHLGPAGVKGGVVVDFGPMTDGVTGCQPVPTAEIDAILADLDGHYVELHDPVEDFTVRAQLSEGTDADGVSLAMNDEDEASADAGGPVLFDPDGGGAIAIIEPGRIVLRGEVADRETAERVLVDFAGLSSILVVDELTTVAGAPLPSGRVVIDSPDRALFASDSDQLDPGADPLVDQVVALLGARPDWNVTVVGHTDSTGNEVINLELSLRRAEAVRQELLDGGVAADRVRVRGAGSTDPIDTNDTIAGRANNRRIEFEIAR